MEFVGNSGLKNTMEQRIKEAVRYLGYRKYAVDEPTLQLISEGFSELEALKRERFVYRFFTLELLDVNRLTVGELTIESKDLKKNLEGCESCVIFAATLGAEMDACIRKYSVANLAKAVVVQACAATLMEELCDKIEAEIREIIKGENKVLKPRFSPGYGDLSFDYQKNILEILDTPRKIGLTMTQSYILLPAKSVTAFIGIQKRKDRL